jgi:hypothetical protein
MKAICEICGSEYDDYDEVPKFCPLCEGKLSITDKILINILKETKNASESSDRVNQNISVLAVGAMVVAILSLFSQMIPLPDNFKLPFLVVVLGFYLLIAFLVLRR